MSGQYKKCDRCDKFFFHNLDHELDIGSFDSELGNHLDLCDNCFKSFRSFIKEGRIQEKKP